MCFSCWKSIHNFCVHSFCWCVRCILSGFSSALQSVSLINFRFWKVILPLSLIYLLYSPLFNCMTCFFLIVQPCLICRWSSFIWSVFFWHTALVNGATQLIRYVSHDLCNLFNVHCEFHLHYFIFAFCILQVASLLLETLLLLGYFALLHPGNQAVLRWGKSPTILHKVTLIIPFSI